MNPAYLDASYLADLATIASAFIAFFGLGFIYWQLRENGIQTRRQRSYEFAGKYHAPEYLPHMIRASKFLRNCSTNGVLSDSAWKQFNEDETTRTDVGICLSFFEEMGGMYNRNLIDKGVMVALLSTAATFYFEWAKPLTDKMRELAPTTHEEWEKMYNSLKKK